MCITTSEIEFTREVTRMRPALYSLTRRFTRDHDDCLDLVQDTLLKAIIYRERFRENTNLKGWLFTIMRNTFLNNYRKNQRTCARVDIMSDKQVASIEERSLYEPQETLQCKEIWLNVNRMKDELLIPFKMYVTGYKYAEIAERLNIPIGTVKNRIFQARKEMQKKLLGYN